VVNGVRSTVARWPRVYTIRVALLVVVLALAGTADAQAPRDLTIEPTMVKGSATAAVTIVEFSDYQ
jgi:protein-disulfide isomerase